MTMMHGFDVRHYDIYEDDTLGPPPRFLVEAERNDVRALPQDTDEKCGDGGSTAVEKLKAFINAIRW